MYTYLPNPRRALRPQPFPANVWWTRMGIAQPVRRLGGPPCVMAARAIGRIFGMGPVANIRSMVGLGVTPPTVRTASALSEKSKPGAPASTPPGGGSGSSMPSWFTNDTLISGVPNYLLAGGSAFLVVLAAVTMRR